MRTRDKHVDDYIAKSPAFAKPILTKIRDTVYEHYTKVPVHSAV
jgi:hypothetical protein